MAGIRQKNARLFGKARIVSYALYGRIEGLKNSLWGGPCEFLSELGLCGENAGAFFILTC
jgi:hypothetical protein